MTMEKKKEIKKALSFGVSDEVICDTEEITPAELKKIKEEIENGSV